MTGPLILPPLRRTAADAETFARRVHAGQVDAAGEPCAEHLRRVAGRTMAKVAGMPGVLSPDLVSDTLQIAWLHDVVADTAYVGDDLIREGFSRAVVDGVMLLTRDAGQPSIDRVRALCEVAPLPVLLVMLSDDEDDADPGRLAGLDGATRARLLAQSEPSMAMLRDAARAKGWRGPPPSPSTDRPEPPAPPAA